jgi:Protein of unknown function (DUF4058)
MPLLDHYRPPLALTRKWESFHTLWLAVLVEELNSLLPNRYFAEAQTHFGNRVEIDVATLESAEGVEGDLGNRGGGVAVETYAPPLAMGVFPAVFPDDFEIQVFRDSGGATLVGAIELMSPGNKDRPETRRAFAAKCAAYLQRGVGLVVVDIVTERQANVHDELMELLRHPGRFPGAASLYAVSYRPVHRESTGNHIEIWTMPLGLGEALPTLPLWLCRGPVIPIELEVAYEEARKRGRLL